MASPPKGVVPATPRLTREFLPHISPAHRREVSDVGGIDAETGLLLSLAVSLESYVFIPRPDNPPVFMMGVEDRSVLTGSAVVWMLGSELVNRHPAGVLRAARWGLWRAFFITGAESLEQVIPDWYRTGLRFVEHLGFRLEPSVFRGTGEAPLYCATVRRRDFIETWEKKWERCKPYPPSPAPA